MRLNSSRSRREFLRVSGTGLLGVAVAGLLGACQSTPSAPAPKTEAPKTGAAPVSGQPAVTQAPSKPAAPAASGAADAPILATLTGAERDRVAGLIEGARKEGELSWIDAIIVSATANKMTEAFKQKYGLANLKMNHERLQSAQLLARVKEEVSANRVLTDIFAVASPRFYYDLKDAGAMLQYESPEYKAFESSNKAGLPYEQGYWVSPVAYCQVPVANTKAYPTPIEKWADLNNPQLKGKFTFPNISGSETSLYTYIGLRKVLPLDYFKSVAGLALKSSGSSVEETQKLASGELLLSVTSNFRTRQTVAQTSVPMKAYYPSEGVTMLGQPYGILAKAPHPNAAKLFVDFMFSEEGQSMYVELEGIISGRENLKLSDEAKQYSPPLSSIKSIPMDWKALDSKSVDAARAEWDSIANQ